MTSWALTVAAYLGVVGLAVLVELLARRRPDVLPTLQRVVTWAMRRRTAQLGLLFTWWWLGWHFVTAR